jgi:hypothetical protein
MAGRPRFLSEPRGLTFQIEAADYQRLVEMLMAFLAAILGQRQAERSEWTSLFA